ncbi:MAG: molybdate ABC transporter substrate-binding protein [Anaerohalosphaeraceae bacterium]
MSDANQKPQVPESKPIFVFAASGTAAAVQRIAALYSQENHVQIQLNLASSAVLARQIEAGADWDVFISANRQWMDYVIERKSLKAAEVVKVLKDRLALIVPADSGNMPFAAGNPSFAQHFQGLLAIGDPVTVPAGVYAKQALEKMGWWQSLSSRMVLTVDTAAILRYVETKQCQAGIVYLSSAKMSSRVLCVSVFDESLHDPIYFFATANVSSERGRLFLQYLTTSARAAEIFTACGFQPVKE